MGTYKNNLASPVKSFGKSSSFLNPIDKSPEDSKKLNEEKSQSDSPRSIHTTLSNLDLDDEDLYNDIDLMEYLVPFRNGLYKHDPEMFGAIVRTMTRALRSTWYYQNLENGLDKIENFEEKQTDKNENVAGGLVKDNTIMEIEEKEVSNKNEEKET